MVCVDTLIMLAYSLYLQLFVGGRIHVLFTLFVFVYE